MKKQILTMILVISLMTMFALPLMSSAQDLTQKKSADVLKETAGTSYGGEPKQLTTMIGDIIKVLLALLGVIFLILVIYAGFLWMTAGGDKEKVDKAQDILKRAVIGLVITMAGYAIADFVIKNVSEVTDFQG
jgi:uncharacterized membrane protein YjgN (DUF898 family)